MNNPERRAKREHRLGVKLWQCGFYLTQTRDEQWAVVPYDDCNGSRVVVDARGVIDDYLDGAGVSGDIVWWACVKLGLPAWDGSVLRNR